MPLFTVAVISKTVSSAVAPLANGNNSPVPIVEETLVMEPTTVLAPSREVAVAQACSKAKFDMNSVKGTCEVLVRPFV